MHRAAGRTSRICIAPPYVAGSWYANVVEDSSHTALYVLNALKQPIVFPFASRSATRPFTLCRASAMPVHALRAGDARSARRAGRERAGRDCKRMSGVSKEAKREAQDTHATSSSG
jgi:hypothetical protein